MFLMQQLSYVTMQQKNLIIFIIIFIIINPNWNNKWIDEGFFYQNYSMNWFKTN